MKNKGKTPVKNAAGSVTRWWGRAHDPGGISPEEMRMSELTSRTEADNVFRWVLAIMDLTNDDGGAKLFSIISKEVVNDIAPRDLALLVAEAEEMMRQKSNAEDANINLATLSGSLMFVACAYAAKAIREPVNSNLSWSYATEANRWLGILQGLISGAGLGQMVGEKMKAQVGGNARNSENKDMKAQVFKWCDDNMTDGRSLQSAADEIVSQRILPIKPGTTYQWVREWNQVRSASTT